MSCKLFIRIQSHLWASRIVNSFQLQLHNLWGLLNAQHQHFTSMFCGFSKKTCRLSWAPNIPVSDWKYTRSITRRVFYICLLWILFTYIHVISSGIIFVWCDYIISVFHLFMGILLSATRINGYIQPLNWNVRRQLLLIPSLFPPFIYKLPNVGYHDTRANK